MRIIYVALGVFCVTLTCFAQSSQSREPQRPQEGQSITGPGITGLPLRRPVKPAITLRVAIKIAERYLKKEKVNVANHILSEATLIQAGVRADVREQHWLFVWSHETGLSPLKIQIAVAMNGKATRVRAPDSLGSIFSPRGSGCTATRMTFPSSVRGSVNAKRDPRVFRIK